MFDRGKMGRGAMGTVLLSQLLWFICRKKSRFMQAGVLGKIIPISKSLLLQFSFFFFLDSHLKKKNKKPDSQPAVVAVGDLGHLSGDARHLEVIHLEDPAPRDVDVGGLGDVYDGVGAGAGDVVVVGFISAVEAGLKIGKKRRIWGLNTTLHGINFMGQPSNVGVVDPNLLLLMLLTPTFCWCC